MTEILELDGLEVKFSNPEKVFFPELGLTKRDLLQYYLDVMPGVLVGCRDRPTMLKRHPHGVHGDFFYQKRVPKHRPEWIETVTVSFPSGRTAEFLAPQDSAHVAWAINLGCIDLNPWPVRRADVDHPDELRVDLDPTPEAKFEQVREVALVVREVLEEHSLVGFPKTSGKRGMHIYVRIEPKWEFTQVRLAALALAREVERREPAISTTAWWKEERHGVFIDYNQNARDRTIASVYSVRPSPEGLVSCPLDWSEVANVDPYELNIKTVPKRFKKIGDPGARIDSHPGGIESLLELGERQKQSGVQDAPWPPHFEKQPDEPTRVQPSRAVKKEGRPGSKGGRTGSRPRR